MQIQIHLPFRTDLNDASLHLVNGQASEVHYMSYKVKKQAARKNIMDRGLETGPGKVLLRSKQEGPPNCIVAQQGPAESTHSNILSIKYYSQSVQSWGECVPYLHMATEPSDKYWHPHG